MKNIIDVALERDEVLKVDEPKENCAKIRDDIFKEIPNADGLSGWQEILIASSG